MIVQPNKLYLGREFSAVNQAPMDEPLLLNIRELTTHALCLGMTGTGKTGLGVTVLEEVLLQGIPSIIIDPKGDITNLALSFPDLSADSFRPWVDASSAEQQGIQPDELAEQTAANWRNGLAKSGISPERIKQFNERVDVRIYTPGSEAGIPVNVLQGLHPPPETNITWARNADVLRERIAQTCSALLEVIGINADPIKSREHILLATIFESAWRAHQPLDITLLIRMIQSPPVARVGVLDLEAFYPKADRFELAMALNNLAASPSFQAWQMGDPINIEALTKPIRGVGGSNPTGKTRASIFYLAHLGEAERQFFVTLLLSQIVTWMRAQTGTSVLKCLVYFDEIFGYCPPFPRNPATKAPIMALLKQGRASGLGMFLATQNPGDLDYKGLSNIGTWMIGRLRTERDRNRALEGLEGAGVGFDRDEMEGPLATLPQRTFLIQNVSSGARFLQTRWTMSYLRGPMTRDQVAQLADDRDWRPRSHEAHPAELPHEAALGDDLAHDVLTQDEEPIVVEGSYARAQAAQVARSAMAHRTGVVAPVAPASVGATQALKPKLPTNRANAAELFRAIQQRQQAQQQPQPITPPSPVFVRPRQVLNAPIEISHFRPILPNDVREVFMTVHTATTQPDGVRMVYRPHLLASATARITERANGIMYDERHTYLLSLDKLLRAPDYSRAQKLSHFDASELAAEPMPDASYAALPAGVSQKWMNQSERLLVEHIYRNVVASVWHNRSLKIYGQPNENKIEFRRRCEEVVQARREVEVTRLHQQYEQRMGMLQERLAREERELSMDRKELDARKREETLTNIESVFNFVVGRQKTSGRSVSVGALKRRQTEMAEMEVRESEDTIEQLNENLARLADEYHIALNNVNDKWMTVLNDMHESPLVPRKSDIFVDFIALAWVA